MTDSNVDERRPSYPRQSARTQRFTLGAPRSFTLSPDGARVAFLRSRTGSDRLTCLWVLDVEQGRERLVVDPAALLAGGEEELPPQERARRERLREGSGGVVAYSTDHDVRRAAFALSGRLFVVGLEDGEAAPVEVEVPGPVVDPRADPTGRRVAFVARGALHVAELDGGSVRTLVEPDGPDVTWGLAEFVAAEEMGRSRGFWWAPDGESLLVARVDDSPVQRWWISDPEHPDREPARVAYPRAGTPNAEVRLFAVALDGTRTEVAWDRGTHEYLAAVHWSSYGEPLLAVQSRDQRSVQVRTVDVATGATELLAEDTDDTWVELHPGTPAWTPSGRLVRLCDRGGARRLLLDEDVVTPDGLQVLAVLDVDERGVLLQATGDPVSRHVWLVSPDGTPAPLTAGAGVRSGRLRGPLLLLSESSLDAPGATVTLRRHEPGSSGPRGLPSLTTVTSYAETPVLTARPELLRVGQRALATALLLPSSWSAGDGPLPVLLDPYGGPHGPRVLAAHNAHLSSQWFADQGFAVLVVDGRGTPARGPEWERAVHLDVAGPVLQDQVDALHAVAERRPRVLDLSRVAVRGWSFGGFLAALAVLRRPDVFAAAVAGAPVTDWALYDTHYTERYLGRPDEQPQAYAGCNLVADAARLERPLLLVHGLADDNVVAANTLQLSSALLAAGRPHTVLPLSGVTHMTPQEVVAENLLLLQVEFLRGALGVPR